MVEPPETPDSVRTLVHDLQGALYAMSLGVDLLEELGDGSPEFEAIRQEMVAARDRAILLARQLSEQARNQE